MPRRFHARCLRIELRFCVFVLLSLFLTPSLSKAKTGNICWRANANGDITFYAGTYSNQPLTQPVGGLIFDGFVYDFTGLIDLPPTNETVCRGFCCDYSTLDLSWQIVTIPAPAPGVHSITCTDGPVEYSAGPCATFLVDFLDPPALDCNQNGRDDPCDIELEDCNANDRPDECDAWIEGDCNGDNYPDSCLAVNDLPVAKLLASDRAHGDIFGNAVSLSADGNVAVIGAQWDDFPGMNDKGSAYVFRRIGTTWIQEQKLSAPDGAANEWFGASVSISGNVIVIGSTKHSHSGDWTGVSGAVYIYRFNGSLWIEEQEIRHPDGEYQAQFGAAVVVRDDVIVVGAPLTDSAGTNSGSAYVFRYNGQWNVEGQLVASDAATESRFGFPVSLDQNNIVVGSLSARVAYVFRFNGSNWLEDQILTAPIPDPSDGFGRSVCINGDRIVVGAPLENGSPCDNCGSAYVFHFDGSAWAYEQKLLPPTPNQYDLFGDRFGNSLALKGNVIIVGADWDDTQGGPASGSAYVFRLDDTAWVLEQRLLAADAAESDHFGESVATNGDIAIIGAYQAACPEGGSNVLCGTAYVFSNLNRNVDCNDNAVPDDCELDSDQDGLPDECEADCNLNGIPDDFDIASGFSEDDDGDAVPNECDSPNPLGDPTEFAKNRFLSFSLPWWTTGSPGTTAIRVTLRSLHQVVPPYTGGASIPFTSFQGQVRWVGPPTSYVESTSSATPFYAASLQCAPHYQDWSTVGLLHVTGSAIVPSSVYEVENVAASCMGIEASCTAVSAPLTVSTTRWGDVEMPFNPPSPTVQPDVGDISALVNKFRSSLGAPIKARALLAGSDGFGNINLGPDLDFSHIAVCVDAFRGKPYPYTIQECP